MKSASIICCNTKTNVCSAYMIIQDQIHQPKHTKMRYYMPIQPKNQGSNLRELERRDNARWEVFITTKTNPMVSRDLPQHFDCKK